MSGLVGQTNGWASHPASKMWKGFEYALATYGMAMCWEWLDRGFQDNLLPVFDCLQMQTIDTGYPPWLGDEKFHGSHRSNLLRKDFRYYVQFCWSEPNNLPYWWPSHVKQL